MFVHFELELPTRHAAHGLTDRQNTWHIMVLRRFAVQPGRGRITSRADMPRSLQAPNWVPPSMGMRCTEAEQAVREIREIGISFSKVQLISMVILWSDVRTDTSNSFLQHQWWALSKFWDQDEVLGRTWTNSAVETITHILEQLSIKNLQESIKKLYVDVWMKLSWTRRSETHVRGSAGKTSRLKREWHGVFATAHLIEVWVQPLKFLKCADEWKV